MTPVIYKVFAYITNQNRLLVFRHTDFPEAGIQVPAGTVMAGEDLRGAVMREAQEETGLSNLAVRSYLGEQVRDMSDVGKAEVHHRHFFHLVCNGDPPNEWQHDETNGSDDGAIPIHFDLFWAALPDQIPELICDHGIMLPILEKRISDTNQLTP